MGAGKGQTHRTQTTIDQRDQGTQGLKGNLVKINFDILTKWSDELKQSYPGVTIEDYYLRDRKNTEELSDEEVGFVFTEVFLDSVEEGVFTFDKPVDLDRFAFSIHCAPNYPADAGLHVEYKNQDGTIVNGQTVVLQKYFRKNVKLEELFLLLPAINACISEAINMEAFRRN